MSFPEVYQNQTTQENLPNPQVKRYLVAAKDTKVKIITIAREGDELVSQNVQTLRNRGYTNAGSLSNFMPKGMTRIAILGSEENKQVFYRKLQHLEDLDSLPIIGGIRNSFRRMRVRIPIPSADKHLIS